MHTFDNGLAQIRHGHRTGSKIHLMRPPIGEGIVCDPKQTVDTLAPVTDTDQATCGVCLNAASV